MSRNSTKMERSMGRRPIHEQAMSDAERQRRRRAKVRAEPWRDHRMAVRAILQALRNLRTDESDSSPVDTGLIARITDQAVAQLAPRDDEAAEAAREMVSKLLDPKEPLPERGQGGRGKGRGRRSGGGGHSGRGRRHRGRDQSIDQGESDE